VPQSWIPYVQMGFSIVSYSNILFSSVSCKFLANSQYILLAVSPKYLRIYVFSS